MKKLFYILTIFAISFVACRTEVEEPKEIGKSLYPEDIGREVVYKVDSIVYDDYKLRIDNKPDTFQFQLKEVITSKMTGLNGEPANRVVIYKRLNDSFGWEPYKVISTQVNTEGMQRVEDNARYLKLTFPVAENKTWNSNVYNAFNQTETKYTQIYKPGFVGGFTLDSLVTVEQKNDSNFIEKRFFKEIYASRIGLVYGQYDSINYQGSYNASTGRYYWKGLLIRKTMLSHNP